MQGSLTDADWNRRFGGIARLYGEEALGALSAATVTVIGVGGVGSWAVEALARSAVGGLRLIDPDHVAESNINRQLPALASTLGRAKVEVLKERVAAINPVCEVRSLDQEATADNLEQLIGPGDDWVIDCIDSARVKAAIIAFCKRRKQPVLTVGGAGGRQAPGRARISDLRRTEQDPLLARTRRQLRRDYGFPTNPRRRFGVPCVWSDEPQVVPSAPCDTVRDSSLNCAGFGACMPVTATFGLLAAGHVISAIAAEGRQSG